MERILRGIMRYRNTTREQMVREFQKVRDNPEPKAVFFTCMDSRMIPTRYTDTHVGDMFVVRNAGNLIPHAQHFQDEHYSCEPAALELGCVVNDIRHIIVCGHSDCKAMNLLYQLRDPEFASKPKAVFFTCMDSRMIPTRYTDTHVGDMFVVRNAGNLIPHAQHFQDEHYSCEPAALELGCVVNDIRHIIVCGHSDCKAMNLLYQLRDPEFASKRNRRLSPLRSWLCTHASTSLEKFEEWKENGMSDPLLFSSETPLRRFVAYIDPENKFAIEDKLSQINTLEQMSNIASYGFLKARLESHDLHIHALWFDIYTGDIYYFSRGAKRFIHIDEQTVDRLTAEVRRFYS